MQRIALGLYVRSFALESQEKPPLKGFVTKLFLIVFLFSLAVGLLVYRNYRTFEKEMLASYSYLENAGAQFTLEQCVDAVLLEVEKCTTMKVLCVQAVPRLMGGCLSKGEHLEECKLHKERLNSSHFGYAECAERGQVGRRNKPCGTSYRAFADYCKGTHAGKY